MRRTHSGRARWPPGTAAVVLALLLAVAASAFSLFAPSGTTERSTAFFEPCNRDPEPGATRRCPRGASGVAVSQRWTDDGVHIVHETVSYPSGRTEVREYRRPAKADRTSLLDEQPEAIIPVVAIALGLAGIPLVLNGTALRRRARAVAAALLLVISVIAGFSVGLVFLPSATAMAVAAARG